MTLFFILAIVVIFVFGIGYLMSNSGNPSDSSNSNSKNTSTSRYSPTPYNLNATRGQVVSNPTKYRRPNADGSQMFEGTEFTLKSAFTGQTAQISCEGSYDIVNLGDVIDIVFAKYEIKEVGFSSNLVVAVFNSSDRSFNLIKANVEKCANANFGGSYGLERDIENYSRAVLNYNIRVS